MLHWGDTVHQTLQFIVHSILLDIRFLGQPLTCFPIMVGIFQWRVAVDSNFDMGWIQEHGNKVRNAYIGIQMCSWRISGDNQ